ncbi:DUF7524 family protein [Halopelagius longus]|uniref:Uncharacterized protein n=1 Tax=Halopelagius longus TaxID=1236180 RepID=A0A1H1BMV8_9EURY|nr:hypothetical protein [Halopelagius longus]RDI70849.1 hypothetical protein DWB78_03415 [Halopelagius longus]SDQ53301.1 hypothetical protein SAMN05216278_1869 [Halopelagius longus]
MSESLRVELNGEGLHTITAPPEFEADGPFVVVLENAGAAVHVHVHLDDALSAAARLESGNHYVEEGGTQRVRVGASSRAEPVTGTLRVVTGYGAEEAHVRVTLDPAAAEKSEVEVDEEFSRPPRREPESSPVDELREAIPVPSRTVVPFLGLVGLSLLVAAVVVATVDSTALVLGVGVVLGAMLVATAFLIR